MFTPDNDPASTSTPPAASGGVNAWKLNPAKLVPPRPAGTQEQTFPAPPVSPTEPAPKKVVPGVRSPRRRRFGILLAAAAALVAAVVFTWTLDRPSPFSQSPTPRSGIGSRSNQASGTETPTTVPSYRALVIGVNRYQPVGNGEGWQALQSARADAESVARVLASDYGFKVQTLLDGEATRSAILNALDDMATSGTDGADLIYFAGHGYFDEKLQEGYWIPADARRTAGGREAKEDWLWNSTLTRLISASHARHVLVLSDACYSGSLFRGNEPLSARNSQAWYERAIAKPSRYLITSGGIEPVLDSGIGHSVFAQQVLNFLQHSDRDIFSANDLGSALRERVAALTGQMVQMGPLPVSGHAGGEFVFVRQKDGVQRTALAPHTTAPHSDQETRGADDRPAAQPRQDTLRDALALTRAGAPKSANSLISGVLQQNAQDQLARSVADYVSRSQRQEGRDELQKLIGQLEAKGKENAAQAASHQPQGARPRILACLGPTVPSGGPAAESAGLLYRIALRSELENRAGLRVIEREALETLLQEQNLGTSDLADPRARTAIGKLLPASLLLLGDVLPSDKGDKLFLRLVDTETTQVLASFTATRRADEDPESVCTNLASRIAERVATLKPLLAPVTGLDGTRIRAALGTFHGVRAGLGFSVVTRIARDKKAPDDLVEKEVGHATLREVSEFSCEADLVWKDTALTRVQDLWIRELAAPTARP